MKNIKGNMKQFMWDVSGAFGDIGVLLPIAIVLIGKNGFNPTALFLAAGLYYILSASYFRITMPVQPLKAMSAIAITAGLGPDVINTAGVIIGCIFLALTFTGLSVKIGKLFPVSVIRGIQLGLGILLVKASIPLMSGDPRTAVISGAVLVGVFCFMKGIPPLILLMIFGIALSMGRIHGLSFGPVALTPALPEPGNFWVACAVLVLPQIALSIGNAIVATEATGKLLYGQKADRLTLRSIPLSMGIANIASGLIGGVPMCHGSGGLTAHAKFGATGTRSGYIIGGVLIALALLLGTSGLAVISAFPVGILGILLCYVGIQHAMFLRDIMNDKADIFIAVSIAVVSFITNNLTIGFAAGIGIHYTSGLFKECSDYPVC
jgi:SulP family sulfate permease